MPSLLSPLASFGGGLDIAGMLSVLPGAVPSGNGRSGQTSFVGQLLGMFTNQAAHAQAGFTNAVNQGLAAESEMRNLGTAPMAGIGTVEGASPEVVLMIAMLLMHQLASEKMNYETNVLKDNMEKQKAIHEQQKVLRDQANQLQTQSDQLGQAQNAVSGLPCGAGSIAGAATGAAKSGVDSQLRAVNNEVQFLENREKELEDFSQLKMMRIKQLEQLVNMSLQTWNSADDAKKQTLSAISGSISR
jgi:hypothetical protein